MDSVCDGAGPREPSKVCQAEINCVFKSDTQTKEADNSAITELPKDVADVAAASLESPRQDVETVADGRTQAKVPKPGTNVFIHSFFLIPCPSKMVAQLCLVYSSFLRPAKALGFSTSQLTTLCLATLNDQS